MNFICTHSKILFLIPGLQFLFIFTVNLLNLTIQFHTLIMRNRYLAIEKSKQLYVKLYPENSSLTRENPPIASFNIKIVFPLTPNRQTLIHPGLNFSNWRFILLPSKR